MVHFLAAAAAVRVSSGTSNINVLSEIDVNFRGYSISSQQQRNETNWTELDWTEMKYILIKPKIRPDQIK